MTPAVIALRYSVGPVSISAAAAAVMLHPLLFGRRPFACRSPRGMIAELLRQASGHAAAHRYR